MTISNLARTEGITTAVATAEDLAGASPCLLPEPQEVPSMDAMSELYALMADQRRTKAKNAAGGAARNLETKRTMRKRMLEAIHEAEEAEKKSGFFGSLSKKIGVAGQIAAVVGATALVVSTGGGAAVAFAIAGAALSSASFAQNQTHFLQSLGMGDKTADYVGLGMGIGGAACSGGAGILAGSSSMSGTASAADKTAQIVGGAANAGAGVSGAAASYAALRGGLAAADADDAMADATGAQAQESMLHRLALGIVEALRESEKSDERTMGLLRDAIQAKGATLTMAAGRV